VLGVIGAAGLGLAALTTRLKKSFLFGVTPLDPQTLVAAAITLIGCAMLASRVPARRAGEVDRAVALRAE
jgi:ABC-type lipoprotein release transport system permease subunit